jgi:PhnB protein
MKIMAHLHFNGNGEAALKFYAKCLGGKVGAIMYYADTPMADKVGPDWAQKVIHGRLEVKDQVIAIADDFPGFYHKPQGMSVTLDVETPEEAEKIYTALSEKGTIQMAMSETFWARRFAAFTDQFGTPWMINCSKATGK